MKMRSIRYAFVLTKFVKHLWKIYNFELLEKFISPIENLTRKKILRIVIFKI